MARVNKTIRIARRTKPAPAPLARNTFASYHNHSSRRIAPFVDCAPRHELSRGDVVIDRVRLGGFHLQWRIHPEERFVAANALNSRNPKMTKRSGDENHSIVVPAGVLNSDCPHASSFA